MICVDAVKKNHQEGDTSALEQEIDQLVYKPGGLTEEEVRIVEGSHGRTKGASQRTRWRLCCTKILITPDYHTTELVQDIWSRYGFKGNPFDTAALSSSTGALLPVSKAYVDCAHCIDGVARFLAR